MFKFLKSLFEKKPKELSKTIYDSKFGKLTTDYVESDEYFNWAFEVKNKTEKATREERVRRIENFHWQLRYLKVFWAVMEDKYSRIFFKNKNDKLRFYATAYNFGFLRPEKMIINYQNKKAFPYGINKKNVARFADFSLDFYTNYASLLNP